MRKIMTSKMRMRAVVAGAAVAAFSVAFLGTANVKASALNPGGSVTPAAETLAGDTLVTTTGVLPYTTPRETGKYEASVYKEASGTLDFVYRFTNDSSSLDAIRSVTMASFQGTSITDAAYVNTGGTAPVNASLDASGSVPKFTYDTTGVTPGTFADTLVLRTNATSFNGLGFFTLQDGGAANLPGFQPNAVPVPAPLGAAGVLLSLVGLVQWLRSRTMA
jgi:hypothetical protein